MRVTAPRPYDKTQRRRRQGLLVTTGKHTRKHSKPAPRARRPRSPNTAQSPRAQTQAGETPAQIQRNTQALVPRQARKPHRAAVAAAFQGAVARQKTSATVGGVSHTAFSSRHQTGTSLDPQSMALHEELVLFQSRGIMP